MRRQAARAYSKAEQRELWRRWYEGESLPSIARALDRLPGSVREFFLRFGGIEPPGRKRRDGSLTLEEREEISRGHAEGQSFRDDQVIIVGSFNYTGPANALNGENILVIGDLDETNAQAIANQRQLGLYARQEIDRIVQAFGEPL